MRRLRETYPSQPNMQARCVGGKNEKFLSLLIFNIIITGLQGSRAYAHLLPARPTAALTQIHKAPHCSPPIWQVFMQTTCAEKYT